MKRRVARLTAVLVSLTPVLAVAASVIVAACGKDRTLASAGEDCDLATDCLPGLVCIEERSGRRVCSNDLSGVQGELPPDGGEPAADDGGEGGTPVSPDGSTPPPPDGGQPVQDSGSIPPMDAAADG